MDKLKLIKLFFYADRQHLAQYARPVLGGDYYAMDLGPVSSQLKNHVDEAITSSDLPFVVQGEYNLVAKEPISEGLLSESDFDVLEETYKRYGHIDSVRLSLMTHKLKVWKKNEPERGGRKPITYEDFFEDLRDDGIYTVF